MGGREAVAENRDYETNGASGARQNTFVLKGADKRPRRTQRENRPSLGRLKKAARALHIYAEVRKMFRDPLKIHREFIAMCLKGNKP
jgi:hypothetical protein